MAEPARTLDTHHCLAPPPTLQEWRARTAVVRQRLRLALGLEPMPPRTPLRPIVTGRYEAPDFIVENVAIETVPGFWLCGNLYRPRGGRGPFPAVVSPHGHWAAGRLTMEPDVPLSDAGGTRPAEGRANLVAIGVALARLGIVTFSYDMVGYNDTDQAGAHSHFGGDLRDWAWGVSLAGLQTWNSIRALDYLCSLPDVDDDRIGVTGASGGATQSLLLAAVDDRVRAAVPVNMVSAHMQGGCLCENGPGLRVGTDNVEIAALLAPRPLLLVSCTGDWTRNNPTEEWPAIRDVYRLYGAEERTALVHLNYDHNYNVESREAMLAWFARWLLGQPVGARVREAPFALPVSALRVWTAERPRPAGALGAEGLARALRERTADGVEARLTGASRRPRDFARATARLLATSLAVAPPARRPARSGSGRVLLVSTDACAAAEAWNDALTPSGVAVERLALPAIEGEPVDPAKAAYFCTYNRTPLGDRVQSVVDAIGRLRRAGPVHVVGLGEAGLWAAIAAAIALPGGRTLVDWPACALASHSPARYAPALEAAGGIAGACLSLAGGGLTVASTGEALSRAVSRALRGAGARVLAGPASPSEGARWLLTGRP
ncbi:MAG TPA: acyl-CoA thioester hydrolase/BAAT C-terminal domain-containing protein [Chthonomonadales bacterium]|nr:acyl-CoA thioester hydrolase/BAAT C-terminal domain-containing protein [Chthonomonadales bacterium]